MVKARTKSKNRKNNRTHKFPKMMHNIYGKANVSTMAMRAVSNDGNNWHVDTDINGVRNHENLTNSDIMNIMSHRAHKVDLRTRLLQNLKGVDVGVNEYRPTVPQMSKLDQIGMFGEIDYPHVRVYRKNCPMIPKHRLSGPIMMNNLSPLHEARIIPKNEIIHLEPLHLKPVKKHRTKSKKSRKNRK
jgi:hypothetical protein